MVGIVPLSVLLCVIADTLPENKGVTRGEPGRSVGEFDHVNLLIARYTPDVWSI